MSDVSQAPAPPASAPSAPAPSPAAPPAQAEVPVQPQVDHQRPLGDQAPPKPEGQESNKSSHLSRREALAQAFNRAKDAQDEAAKNAPAKRERPAPTKEAAPKDAPQQEAKPDRYREGGRFAKDPSKAQPEQQGEQQPRQQAQPDQQRRQIQPLHESAPYRASPSRFSDQAKQEWHATPESVRGEVYRMAKEFQGAYQKYRADSEVMDEMRPYHELAQKQGTSIRRAFDNYYGMEAKLRQDLIGGLDIIVQNVARSQGLTGPHGGPLNLQDVMQHVLTMTPEQRQLSQQRNMQTAAERQMGQMQQQVQQQQEVLNQILYQQKFTYTRSQVDAFADTHPRFDELADLIKAELDHGYSLEVAYARADRLRPATHAAQNRTQSAQTRKTSISGAPDGKAVNTRPSDGRSKANGEAKHPSRREALAKAMRRVGNGV